MYTNTEELPSQVLLSLRGEDREHWMKAYNSKDPKSPEEIREAKRYAWHECRDRPTSFSFSAYASVDDWDRDNEKVSIQRAFDKMARYVDSGGPISFNHRNYTVGNVWDYERTRKDGRDAIKIYGNLYGGDDGVYDEVRKRFVKGVRGFSLAGETGANGYACDGGKCGRVLNPSEIMEIALCPVPANPHAITLEFNDRAAKGFSKSSEGGIPVTGMEIHRDEDNCPILGLRKALRECGIDAHAREDGVFVSFVKGIDELAPLGLVGRPVEGGMLLNERESALESLFKEGFSKGTVDKDGVIDVSDLAFFVKACDMGLTEYDNGIFRFRAL